MAKINSPGFLFCTLLLIFACSCGDKQKSERKKVGDYWVEANFNEYDNIEGVARYYNSTGQLVTISNLKNGSREGATINYFLNGKVKDSILFTDDKQNGFLFHYDSSGRLTYMDYAYYGIKAGPQVFYEKGKPVRYFFADFNKTDLFSSDYDSSGRCRHISAFTTNPVISDFNDEGRPVVEVSAYLPRPVGFEVTFKLGLIDENRKTNDLATITGNGIHWDTLLSVPPQGQSYYISSHLHDRQDSIDKLYIEELRDSAK